MQQFFIQLIHSYIAEQLGAELWVLQVSLFVICWEQIQDGSNRIVLYLFVWQNFQSAWGTM